MERDQVAMKLLRDEDYQSFAMEASILMYVRILLPYSSSISKSFFLSFNIRNLSHPHVVQFHGIYIDEKETTHNKYMITEYMENGSVIQTLEQKDKTLSVLDLLNM